MRKHPILLGTMVLTLTGVISRFIGFFYRIFLSHIFGETGMGIYQLAMPVMSLVFAITVSGISQAVSKYVAEYTAKKEYQLAYHTFLTATLLSVALSVLCSVTLSLLSDEISVHLLAEPRVTPLLTMMCILFPLNSIHCCINGYYYGLKKTAMPAVTQLIEQSVRVGSVFLLFYYAEQHYSALTLSGCIAGLIIGEIAATLLSLFAVIRSLHQQHIRWLQLDGLRDTLLRLLTLSYPITLTRLVVTLLSSVEALLIPRALIRYGMSNTAALGVYGVLTGMTLPLILFPSALPSSASVLLLPVVSEADVSSNRQKIASVFYSSCKYTLLFGFLCCAGFFLLGPYAGELLFSSPLAGTYIRSMSFICPFLYLTTTLSGILHGLGKTRFTFLCNTSGLLIRLLFVIFLVPRFGMMAYLRGLLLFSLDICLLYFLALRKYIGYNNTSK